jgi:thiamine kinase-like enzyme
MNIPINIDIQTADISLVEAKNFNLLVTLENNKRILVKQERIGKTGKTYGEFLSEWRIQEFLGKFAELNELRKLVSEVIYFDKKNSIIIANYLEQYQDLSAFYLQENNFSTNIAIELGKALAKIHKHTFNHSDYQNFFQQQNQKQSHTFLGLMRGLERITPEVFGSVPTEGLKFFVLYQRFDSLGQAIAELGKAFTPACVTHNDLKLNNILLHQNWLTIDNFIVRLIDWERSNWGDPAFDLGTLLGSYLQLWLSSLVISSSLSIEESLGLATIPLEILQPSMGNLMLAYLEQFADILEIRPDFIKRVVQFSGFTLIQQIQAMIQYQKSFGNGGIAMLQVAKSLLCRPEASMLTLFGSVSDQLNNYTDKRSVIA